MLTDLRLRERDSVVNVKYQIYGERKKTFGIVQRWEN